MAELTRRTSYCPAQPRGWQSAYEAVLRESDSRGLFKLVEIAEAAMLTRRDDLAGSLNCPDEREAVEVALNNLRVLKQKRLGFVNEIDNQYCNSMPEQKLQAQ